MQRDPCTARQASRESSCTDSLVCRVGCHHASRYGSSAAKAKADSTLRSSRAVPHPSTNRALRRLTSEFRRDPVHSTRYGRQRRWRLCARSWRQQRAGRIMVACWADSAQLRSRAETSLRFPEDQQEYPRVHVHLPSSFPSFLAPSPACVPGPSVGGGAAARPRGSVPSTCGSHSRLGSVQRPAPARERHSFPARLGAASRRSRPRPPGAAVALVPGPLGFRAPRGANSGGRLEHQQVVDETDLSVFFGVPSSNLPG